VLLNINFNVIERTGAWVSTLKTDKAARTLVVGDECLLSCAPCNEDILEWALPNPKAVVQDAKPQAGLWPILANGKKPDNDMFIRCMQVGPQLPHSIATISLAILALFFKSSTPYGPATGLDKLQGNLLALSNTN
jgi:hypothetical protein